VAALKSTIFKANLQIADMDRRHYGDHALTLARHPSETDERMMVRLLAFALNAEDTLAFGRGLSSDDEPALWQKDRTGTIDTWIEVGLPDAKLLRRACGRARRVIVYAYGTGVGVWWNKLGADVARIDALAVVSVPAAATRALAELAARTMVLQCTIQESHVWISGNDRTVEIVPTMLKAGRMP